MLFLISSALLLKDPDTSRPSKAVSIMAASPPVARVLSFSERLELNESLICCAIGFKSFATFLAALPLSPPKSKLSNPLDTPPSKVRSELLTAA